MNIKIKYLLGFLTCVISMFLVFFNILEVDNSEVVTAGFCKIVGRGEIIFSGYGAPFFFGGIGYSCEGKLCKIEAHDERSIIIFSPLPYSITGEIVYLDGSLNKMVSFLFLILFLFIVFSIELENREP